LPVYICQKCFGQVEPEEVKEVDGRVYHRECAESAASGRIPLKKVQRRSLRERLWEVELELARRREPPLWMMGRGW